MLFSWVDLENQWDGAIVYHHIHDRPIWPQLKT